MENKPTKEKIELWKKAHVDVYRIKVGDLECYVRRPTRAVIDSLQDLPDRKPSKIGEFLLNECWLGGDEEIKHKDEYFYAAVNKLQELTETKEAELEKL